MKLAITIDTEEDSWSFLDPIDYSFNNIERIHVLQDLFNEFNAKPTYLVTYPVAKHEKAVSILKPIIDEGKCEIGAHCHPWNTPPFEEEINEQNSILSNLPPDLQFKKLSYLHNTITKNFGIKPVSFRAGRWGFSREVATNIYKLGYQIDTSITPYTDWSINYGPNYLKISPKPFNFYIIDDFGKQSNVHIVEIPTTIGFHQSCFTLCGILYRVISKKAMSQFRLKGLLAKLRLLNRVPLSPEHSDAKSMIKLTQTMIRKKFDVINLFFHSNSLVPGLSPFVRTKDDEREFFQRIRLFLRFAQDNGIEPATLSDIAHSIKLSNY
jgi:hypothetical protein